MNANLRKQVDKYYWQYKIHPMNFDCKYKAICNQYSNQGMTEAKMSMVGSRYGEKYPRICVVSLDPPNDEKRTFTLPDHRIIDYVSRFHEEEDYFLNRPRVHWAMTQIIVKDILVKLGYAAQPHSAVVHESYRNRDIENVSQFFCHINVAKCCMNNEGKGQAARQVHQNCGYSYMIKELEILSPDILLSQGKDANEIMAELLGFRRLIINLPVAEMVQVGKEQVLWMPMDHPARHTAEIRQRWPYYLNAINKWKENHFQKNTKIK